MMRNSLYFDSPNLEHCVFIKNKNICKHQKSYAIFVKILNCFIQRKISILFIFKVYQSVHYSILSVI